MSEPVGRAIAAALLALVAVLLVVTFVELLGRGAPWSEAGYHRRAAVAGHLGRATIAGPSVRRDAAADRPGSLAPGPERG